MGGRPKPSANGVDLAEIMAERKRRADAEALNTRWQELAGEAAGLGIVPSTAIQTARYEVLVGVLADALGVEASEAMVTIESAALQRAIAAVEAQVADVNLRVAADLHAQHTAAPNASGDDDPGPRE